MTKDWEGGGDKEWGGGELKGGVKERLGWEKSR